jgi:hypothetical protein
MRASVLILASALIALPTFVLADPTGTYNVEGRNASDGSTYTGTVEVTRTGGTYKVVWTIDGKESVGTGIGSHFKNSETIVTGPATDDDTGIAIGYSSGSDNYGIATYFLQGDGTWQGVWAYGGSQSITTETWTKQ